MPKGAGTKSCLVSRTGIADLHGYSSGTSGKSHIASSSGSGVIHTFGAGGKACIFAKTGSAGGNRLPPLLAAGHTSIRGSGVSEYDLGTGPYAKGGAAVLGVSSGGPSEGPIVYEETGGTAFGGWGNLWGSSWGSAGGRGFRILVSGAREIDTGDDSPFAKSGAAFIGIYKTGSRADGSIIYQKTGGSASNAGWGDVWSYGWGGTRHPFRIMAGGTAEVTPFATDETSGAATLRIGGSGVREGGTTGVIISTLPSSPFVLSDAVVKVNGIDLSHLVDTVALTIENDQLDVTKVGDLCRVYRPGAQSAKFQFTFLADYSTASVDAVLSSLLSSNGFPVIIRPTSADVSDTNPEYTATCILPSYTPLTGKVGARAEAQTEFEVTGSVAKVTS